MLKKLGLGRFLVYSGLALGLCTTLLGIFIYNSFSKSLYNLEAIGNTVMEQAIKKQVVLASLDFENVKKMIIFLVVLVPVLFVLYGFILMKFLSNALVLGVEQLNAITSDMVDRIHEVKTSSDSLVLSADEQSSTVMQTILSVDEMNTTIARNAETSQRSKNFSNECRASAVGGREEIERMISSIDQMTESNKSISGQLKKNLGEIAEMVTAINEIGEKTKLINDIVFQTRLLSFNASVEAARAGEHGKGFSVVAQEVGNLAEASGKSAQEISEMLASSSTLVNETSENIKKQIESILELTRSQLAENSFKVNSMQNIFNEIVEKSTLAAEEMNAIDSASQEQISGISGVSKAMGQIEAASQRNNKVAHASASAASELNSQSQRLLEAIDDLNSVIKGRR